jgi:molecular chaperone HtpG
MAEDPLFNIHLNVDYPFKLTGILYFPKVKKNFEFQRDKIQLYCNQVFVTDSVEGIVPDFLTLLHGVLDSPDIPLNVSRSYLQSDSNVKKISTHITKKVADKLEEIFKNNREEFEKKWDDIKIFIEYGIITDEKFYERAIKFCLLKNTDGKYFTFDEYKDKIKNNQENKDKQIVFLYSNNKEDQHSYIERAKEKQYDVLLMDGVIDNHFVNTLEQKLEKTVFKRVDSDVIEKLIEKDTEIPSKLNEEEKDALVHIFNSYLKGNGNYYVLFENLSETDSPIVNTQNEFMRRMKDMSTLGGGGFYGSIPDSYNIVLNANHPLIVKISQDMQTKIGNEINLIKNELNPIKEELNDIQKNTKEDTKEFDSIKIKELNEKIKPLENKKENLLTEYAKENKIVKQMIDLALLSQNMLKGEDLTKFIKRSIELL